MPLGDITSVLSRYFVVGFFLPAYISLVALWLAASSNLIPADLENHSEATQLLIIGGIAVVIGLALSGVSYYLTRLYEGYPLERVSGWPVVSALYKAAVRLQQRKYDGLLKIRDDSNQPAKSRQRAAWCLDRYFPHNRDALLPTRVGNAFRAFERHSNVRWGLDGVTIWPRIETLLSAEERELHVDAKINFYVFTNFATGAFVVGAALIVDQVINAPQPTSDWPLYLLPFALGYLLYRAAIGPAIHWGDAVRSSVDLHRLEIYEKLGVREPTSFSDERQLADQINKALLYGHPLLADELWRTDQTHPEEKQESNNGLVASLKKILIGEG